MVRINGVRSGPKPLQLTMLSMNEEISSSEKLQTVFVAKFSGYEDHSANHHWVQTTRYALNEFKWERTTPISWFVPDVHPNWCEPWKPVKPSVQNDKSEEIDLETPRAYRTSNY